MNFHKNFLVACIATTTVSAQAGYGPSGQSPYTPRSHESYSNRYGSMPQYQDRESLYYGAPAPEPYGWEEPAETYGRQEPEAYGRPAFEGYGGWEEPQTYGRPGLEGYGGWEEPEPYGRYEPTPAYGPKPQPKSKPASRYSKTYKGNSGRGKGNKVLQDLNSVINEAHVNKMSYIKKVNQTKLDEITQIHEDALADLTIGIDWDIDEQKAILADEQAYLNELEAIKNEGLEDAQHQYDDWVAALNDDLEALEDEAKQLTDDLKAELKSVKEREPRKAAFEYQQILVDKDLDFLAGVTFNGYTPILNWDELEMYPWADLYTDWEYYPDYWLDYEEDSYLDDYNYGNDNDWNSYQNDDYYSYEGDGWEDDWDTYFDSNDDSEYQDDWTSFSEMDQGYQEVDIWSNSGNDEYKQVHQPQYNHQQSQQPPQQQQNQQYQQQAPPSNTYTADDGSEYIL